MTTFRSLAIAALGLAACGAPAPTLPPAVHFPTALVLALDDEGQTTVASGVVMPSAAVTTDLEGYVADGRCEERAHTITLSRDPAPARLRDVGEQMTLTAGATTLRLARMRDSASNAFYSLQTPEALPQDLVDVAFPSATPPFAGSAIELPAAPTGLPARVEAIDAQPLELTWTGGNGELMLVSFLPKDRATSPITCRFPDRGRGVVPAELVHKLTAFDRVKFTRFQRRQTEWYVDSSLRVASGAPVAFDVIGLGARSVNRPLHVAVKRVFVTESMWSANLGAAAGFPTGPAGADALCQRAATAAQLGGLWRAYLTVGDAAPAVRIRGEGPWYLVDESRPVGDRSILAGGGEVAISLNERGAPVTTGRVWVGEPGGANCEAWLSASAGSFATVQEVRDAPGSFVQYWPCSAEARLFCFEE